MKKEEERGRRREGRIDRDGGASEGREEKTLKDMFET
jgi:hypothetical protein